MNPYQQRHQHLTPDTVNRQVIAVMRQRLAAGEEVARMYQEPGLAWLERQAEAAEALLAERQAHGHRE
jgi:GGDEF domain-containing protein